MTASTSLTKISVSSWSLVGVAVPVAVLLGSLLFDSYLARLGSQKSNLEMDSVSTANEKGKAHDKENDGSQEENSRSKDERTKVYFNASDHHRPIHDCPISDEYQSKLIRTAVQFDKADHDCDGQLDTEEFWIFIALNQFSLGLTDPQLEVLRKEITKDWQFIRGRYPPLPADEKKTRTLKHKMTERNTQLMCEGTPDCLAFTILPEDKKMLIMGPGSLPPRKNWENTPNSKEKSFGTWVRREAILQDNMVLDMDLLPAIEIGLNALPKAAGAGDMLAGMENYKAQEKAVERAKARAEKMMEEQLALSEAIDLKKFRGEITGTMISHWRQRPPGCHSSLGFEATCGTLDGCNDHRGDTDCLRGVNNLCVCAESRATCAYEHPDRQDYRMTCGKSTEPLQLTWIVNHATRMLMRKNSITDKPPYMKETILDMAIRYEILPHVTMPTFTGLYVPYRPTSMQQEFFQCIKDHFASAYTQCTA